MKRFGGGEELMMGRRMESGGKEGGRGFGTVQATRVQSTVLQRTAARTTVRFITLVALGSPNSLQSP